MSSTRKCGVCGIIGHTKATCTIQSTNAQPVTSIWTPEIHQVLEIHKSTLDLNRVENTRENLRTKLNKWIETKQRKEFIEYSYSHPEETYQNFKESCISDENFCIKAKPWFSAQDESCASFQTYLIENPETRSIPITAECGSGKSNLMNALAFTLATRFDYWNNPIPEEYWHCPSKARSEENMFVITGHSSKDYEKDLADASSILIKENIYHRPDIHKLAVRLMDDPTLLVNATFFVDEARLVVDEGMTIEKFFCQNLNLDKQRMINLNILIVYIDATPDTICLTCDNYSDPNVSPMFVMPNGMTYRGVKYFMDNQKMKEYKNINRVGNIIEGYDVTTQIGRTNLVNLCVSLGNKNHVFRLQGKSLDLINKLQIKGFTIIFDNSVTPIDLKSEMHKGHKRVFILTAKYRCAKRFRLGPAIGVIFEQPSKNPSDPVITQGLLARFFGYYTIQELELCDFRMITLLAPFTRQLYFIKNLRLPDDYMSSHIKNNKVKCKTYPEYLSEQRTAEQRRMNKLLSEGFECSGLVYRTEYEKTPGNQMSIPVGCVLADRCEIYDSIDHFNARCVELRDSVWGFNENTPSDTHEYVCALGSNNPTSNLPKTHDAFKTQIQVTPLEIHINMRAYKVSHNGVNKWAIRYIRKM